MVEFAKTSARALEAGGARRGGDPAGGSQQLRAPPRLARAGRQDAEKERR